ncbi:MAG: ferrous iron transport protein B [Bacteroides sp.]|nr:MAG: ferrous iron transport protein B [Bacteroides sp.]
MKNIYNVLLLGNPNVGKSTIFNKITGLNQKVSNFAGSTINNFNGYFKCQKRLYKIIDTPGIYNLHNSCNNKIFYNILTNKDNVDYPYIIIYVADSSNLKRNLFLYTQVIDLSANIPVVLVLNMKDIALNNGILIDSDELSTQINNSIISINSNNAKDITKLKNKIFYCKKKTSFFLTENIDNIAPNLVSLISKKFNINNIYQCLYIINNYKILFNGENTEYINSAIKNHKIIVKRLQVQETIIRYKFIQKIIQKCILYDNKIVKKYYWYKNIDKIITHPVYGIAIFILILIIIFQCIFTLSKYPTMLINNIFSTIHYLITNNFKNNLIIDLLVYGIIPGIQNLFIFIPQISILFAIIYILEDIGYISRIIFIMDHYMRHIGLNGYSVIALISGMACSVPAIVSSRNIKNYKERLITILVTPLISCSARLPIYILLISLIIPQDTYYYGINYKGLLLFGMYMLSITIVVIYAYLMNKVIVNKEMSSLIIELPKYKIPSLYSIIITMLNKTKIFIIEVSKILITTSVVLWFLSSYGFDYEQKNKIYIKKVSNIEKSYISSLGHYIEPYIAPLGFDWRIGICIISSISAREVFVSSMSTIYSIEFKNDNLDSMKKDIRLVKNYNTGMPLFNMANSCSLLIFYVFSMQCISTLIVMYRETENIIIPIIYFIWMTLQAYFASWIVYNIIYRYFM